MAALGVAFAVMRLLERHRQALPLDAPNTRSLHVEPVPRVGGVAILAGWIAAALLAGDALPGGWPVWLALAGIAAVSLADDRFGMHPAVRLPAHLAAAALAVAAMLAAFPPAPGWLLVGGLVLALAWSANAFNFMDGSDGLAAAMGCLGLAAFAVGTLNPERAALYAALAAAIVPFARANFPPARVFMGDGGAVSLGFMAAACGVGEWLAGGWPGWFPVLVFLPFLADATVTLLRRLLRRERIWEAHREHFYQRLHRLGAGHRGTLLAYAALMAGSAASALLTLRIEPGAGWIVLSGWCAVLASFFVGIDYHWRRRSPTLQ